MSGLAGFPVAGIIADAVSTMAGKRKTNVL